MSDADTTPTPSSHPTRGSDPTPGSNATGTDSPADAATRTHTRIAADTHTGTHTATGTGIALITGGSRGLGRASALAVAAEGTDVILTYRTGADEAAALVGDIRASGRRAVALQLDTSEVDTFADFAAAVSTALAETWGRSTFDFLVNNAGHAAMTPLGATRVADVDALFAVHFKGVFFLTQTLAPLIADGGRILNISSGLARFAGDGWSVYGAMKGAIEVLTRYHAKELGARGITVNVIAPGPIATDFGGGAMRDNEQARAFMGAQAALGRVGEPDDIGGVVAAMLSTGTGWITGQRVEASGGTLL
jgi:NAD(P)-dependent dehydrogenase (short-subunit alcohol dehydrogenase family)